MRAFVTFVAGLATAALLAAVCILALQNQQSGQLKFLGATAPSTSGLDLAAGAALGFVAALYLLLPGQVANAQRFAALARKLKALDSHMQPLHDRIAALTLDRVRLRDDYRCARDEADHLRAALARLTGPNAVASPAASPINPARDATQREGAAPSSAAYGEELARGGGAATEATAGEPRWRPAGDPWPA